ncbi:MAG: YvcK family protein [Candidatus Gracilibacteria bacterium]|nr:YvcK family protein [Candidatus Gracilibacteria bacterium]
MEVNNKINITTIGGGTGSYNVLSGLKRNLHFNLASVVTMSDSGGSTGKLRDEFGILPPGDLRRAILALSQEDVLLRKLFEYRFDKTSSVSGHTVGNLLITAMADITGDFEKGIVEISKMFRVKGKVVPVTLEKSDLVVVLDNGQEIFGETNIDCPAHNTDLCIKEAYLSPEVKVNPKAREVLENSDIIIIGPGDLYTSIVPNLLVKGVKKAIKNADAKVVYFCNIMTKNGETDGFEVENFVDVIEKYLGKGVLDYVVVNNGHISDEMEEKYKKEESKTPVKVKNIKDFKDKSYKIIERDLLNENDYVRHSPIKIAKVIEDMVEGWIK